MFPEGVSEKLKLNLRFLDNGKRSRVSVRNPRTEDQHFSSRKRREAPGPRLPKCNNLYCRFADPLREGPVRLPSKEQYHSFGDLRKTVRKELGRPREENMLQDWL
ncbi:hypothetical protein TNCV_2026451 [Trichonephila clavipes]|nr:hypothetical protein TNCV_2026451 [Trichonephila clavipes]